MEWTRCTNMETARVEGTAPAVWSAALVAWWQVLCDHAESASGWDTIVFDVWLETGRLIGHVQRADQAIGVDRGARFCLLFPEIAAAIHQAGFTDASLSEQDARLAPLLDASIRHEATRARLKRLSAGRALQLWWCENGSLVAMPTVPV